MFAGADVKQQQPTRARHDGSKIPFLFLRRASIAPHDCRTITTAVAVA